MPVSSFIAEVVQKVEDVPQFQQRVPVVPAIGVSVGSLLEQSTRRVATASSQLRVPSAADVRDNTMWKAIKPVATGALAGMTATTCTQPLDMLKVRVQVAAAAGRNASPFQIATQTVKNEGALVFYKGLSAGLTRQVIYTGGRFGLFDMLTERSKDSAFDSVPGFAKKSICAVTAGGLAAAAGNPADLSLIRMQTDSLLPAAQRRNYRGVMHAMTTIARTEGVQGLFKGASLTSTRAMGSTFGTLAFNAQAKEMLQDAGAPGLVPVLGGSLIAGFASAFFSLPFDFVKTQVQKMKPDPVTGEMPFKGPLDCATKQLKAGGILRLWAGFPTYYMKMAPQVGIALVMQDQIKGMWRTMGI
jgi:solute carrier family 25 oxoglutarate transporter 11